jgi:hypothetical protein
MASTGTTGSDVPIFIASPPPLRSHIAVFLDLPAGRYYAFLQRVIARFKPDRMNGGESSTIPGLNRKTQAFCNIPFARRRCG